MQCMVRHSVILPVLDRVKGEVTIVSPALGVGRAIAKGA